MARNLVITPNISVIKTRNTILRMKNRSPKFKDVLRQKCKERMLQDRSKLLDKFRRIQLNNDFQNDLLCVIAEECEGSNLMELDGVRPLIAPVETKEKVEQEMTEHEQWLIQEYISFLSDEDSNVQRTVICPLCKMGQFESLVNWGITCRYCRKSFRTYKTLSEIHKDIFDTLSEHNKQCDCDSEFGVEQLDNFTETLCVFCNNCFFLKYIL